MPISINLLAEAKAAEEMRRKDPVKRATFIAGGIVSLVILWCVSLQIKIIAANGELSGLEARWKNIDKNYQSAVDAKRRSLDAEEKLAALKALNSNRFLWGSVLNAFQETLNGVDNIHVARLKTEQTYTLAEEVKGKKENGVFTPARPATATEKIAITVDAVDSGSQPGATVSRYKEAIANVPLFQNSLQKTNGVLLTSLSAPQIGQTGRPQVLFTLQCFFPEKVR
ncbi:MAG: hypothetical protein L0Y58_07710 [Verrucomicrobia subdivision 3 bacterium]|nr:hypothetical protein [Limisphaerales bacterium]